MLLQSWLTQLIRKLEAEKQKDATQMKALLMESNASREKSEKLQRRDMPTQEKAIQYLQKQLKELDWLGCIWSRIWKCSKM